MENILHIFTLAPGTIFHFFVVMTILIFLNEFLRIYWQIEHTKSAAIHVAVVFMTLTPALLMIAVLIYSGITYPNRAWLNLFYVTLTFVPWYLAGFSTGLARKDSEGADIGFIFTGFLLVAPAGIITALVAQ